MTPSADAVIRVCVERDLLLCTGHVSPDESLAIARRGRELGARIVVTHPRHFVADPSSLDRYIDAGALVEFSGAPLINPETHHHVREYFEAIRYIGVENVVVSSDVFSRWVSPGPECLRTFAEQLHYLGLTAEELRSVLVDNPRRMLGLAPLGAA